VLAIDRSIPYGAMRLLVARTPEGRPCLGLHSGPSARSPLVFIEVSTAALAALERGELGLLALLGNCSPDSVRAAGPLPEGAC
jgi:hypothetical protein